MAEHSAQDKTESPTAKRREEAREKGNVARSADLNSVAVLFAGILGLSMGGAGMLQTIANWTRELYLNGSQIELTRDSAAFYGVESLKAFASIIAPLLLFLLVAAVGVNVAQVGFLFARKAMIPKFDHINPLSGIKRLFSMRSLVELFKGIFKIAIVTLVGLAVIRKHLDEYWLLTFGTVGETMQFLGSVLRELSIRIGLVLLVLAAADYAYQRYDHEKGLKMTKQEVKDEAKQYENPETKARIRSLQQQTARSRMLAVVPDATVVVTNPTHIAVAIKYDPQSRMDAPKVIAKGKRKIAEKIKAIAREHDIPIIENKPLARSLFAVIEPGMEIPALFYEAVAEILAEVYRRNPGKIQVAA